MISLGYAQLAPKHLNDLKSSLRSYSQYTFRLGVIHVVHVCIYVYNTYKYSVFRFMYGAHFQQLRPVRSLPTLRFDVALGATESETHLPPEKETPIQSNPNPDKFSVRFAHILGSAVFISFSLLRQKKEEKKKNISIQNCEFCKKL